MKQKIKRLVELFRDRANQKKYFNWIMANTKPYMGTLAFFLTIDIIGVGISFASTIVSKYVVDAATDGTGFAIGFAIMAGITLFNIALSAVSSLISTVLAEKYSFGIRVKVYNRILRSDWFKLSKYHSGDLLTRFTSDVDTVTGGISSTFTSFITLTIRLVAAFVILFSYTRSLAFIALILGPVGAIMALLFGDNLKKMSVAVKESEARYRSFMQESIANVTVVKAFRDEEQSVETLTRLRNERLDIILKRNRLNVAMSIAIKLVYAFGYFCAFGYGIWGLAAGTITFGTMTLMLSLVSQIQGPIMSLAGIIPQFIGVLASAGRIMEIEDIGQETDSGDTAMYKSVGVRFESVDFAYTDNEVLRGVNLDIAPGQSLGIVGRSGAGKTTLIRLILALTKPERGAVSFYSTDAPAEHIPDNAVYMTVTDSPDADIADTEDIAYTENKANAANIEDAVNAVNAVERANADGSAVYITVTDAPESGAPITHSEIADAATRRFIAYVPQGNTLMSGTIADNLRGGNPDADEAAMWAALDDAEAGDFVRELPDGLMTKLSERAGGLSEGQAQRVAIARALLRRAPVLILDEATAALDAETERNILARLTARPDKPTCFIITHRRSMLAYCDRAVEIEDGVIRELPKSEL